MIKKILLINFILFQIISSASANESYLLNGFWNKQEYQSEGMPSIYPKNTPFLSLDIELKIKKDNYTTGVICYITRWGNRIDCPIEFKSILKNNVIAVHAQNTWGGILEGEIKIKACGNILHWQLKKLSGEGYALTEGELHKSDIIENHFCLNPQ